MSKRFWWSLLVIATVGAVVGYVTYRDQLPPRTAIKVARLHTGLDVPKTGTVLAFDDDWSSFLGDGGTFIELAFPATAFEPLWAEANDLGYRPLPSERSWGDLATSRVGPGAEAVFIRRRESGGSHLTVILDRSDHRLVVFWLTY